MPLPRQEHNIACSGRADRRMDGGRAVMEDFNTATWSRRGGQERGSDRLSDEVRILAPWVLVGNPDRIGTGCRASNCRTSTWIAFTRRSSDEEQPTRGPAEFTRHSN